MKFGLVLQHAEQDQESPEVYQPSKEQQQHSSPRPFAQVIDESPQFQSEFSGEESFENDLDEEIEAPQETNQLSFSPNLQMKMVNKATANSQDGSLSRIQKLQAKLSSSKQEGQDELVTNFIQDYLHTHQVRESNLR